MKLRTVEDNFQPYRESVKLEKSPDGETTSKEKTPSERDRETSDLNRTSSVA
jgi:hypothetical protein